MYYELMANGSEVAALFSGCAGLLWGNPADGFSIQKKQDVTHDDSQNVFMTAHDTHQLSLTVPKCPHEERLTDVSTARCPPF